MGFRCLGRLLSYSWGSAVTAVLAACCLTAGVSLSRLLVVLQLGFRCFGCLWSYGWGSTVSAACGLTFGVPLSRLLVVLHLGFRCLGCFSSTPDSRRTLFGVLCSPGLVVSSPDVNQRDGTGLGNAFLACHSHVVQHRYSLQYRLLIDA